MGVRHPAALWLVLALGGRWARTAHAQLMYPLPLNVASDTTTRNATRSLSPGNWAFYDIDPGVCRERGEPFLHVEMWDLTHVNRPEQPHMADPMLLLRAGGFPSASYQTPTENDSWSYSAHTLVDERAYQLLRSYHQIVLDVTGQTSSLTFPECAGGGGGASALCTGDGGNLIMGIYNVDRYLEYYLTYAVRASCHATPPCPSPSPSLGPCTDRGVCLSTSTTSSCDCEELWGDVGCDVPVPLLRPDQPLAVNALPWRSWDFYKVVLTQPVNGMLVELTRTRGDPVLFLKNKDMGAVPGGLPTVADYTEFADSDGFRSRHNYHYRQLGADLSQSVPAGTYYVAVFNNDIYLQEMAAYTLSVRVTLGASSQPLCPSNCSAPSGECMPALSPAALHSSGDGVSVCECKSGFAGDMCEGELVDVQLGEPVRGLVVQGGWVFFRLELMGDNAGKINKNLQITVDKAGGYLVMVSKKDELPKLLDNDFIFPTGYEDNLQNTFQVDASELSPGFYYLGFFNMDYYVHSLCEYELTITMNSSPPNMFKPMMSIWMGVCFSIVLCVVLSFFKRMVFRNIQNPLRSTGELVSEQLQQTASARNVPRGLEASVVESFATFAFSGDQKEGKEEDDVTCSVCLCEYEESETLRSLPTCGHYFHIACIDQWLSNNSTCPLCRINLRPESQSDAPAYTTSRGTGTAPADAQTDGPRPSRLLQLSPARFFWSSTVGTPAAPRLETSGTQVGMGSDEDNTTTDLEMAEVLPMPPTLREPIVALPGGLPWLHSATPPDTQQQQQTWPQAANPPPDTEQQLQTQTPSLYTPDSPRVM